MVKDDIAINAKYVSRETRIGDKGRRSELGPGRLRRMATMDERTARLSGRRGLELEAAVLGDRRLLEGFHLALQTGDLAGLVVLAADEK